MITRSIRLEKNSGYLWMCSNGHSPITKARFFNSSTLRKFYDRSEKSSEFDHDFTITITLIIMWIITMALDPSVQSVLIVDIITSRIWLKNVVREAQMEFTRTSAVEFIVCSIAKNERQKGKREERVWRKGVSVKHSTTKCVTMQTLHWKECWVFGFRICVNICNNDPDYVETTTFNLTKSATIKWITCTVQMQSKWWIIPAFQRMKSVKKSRKKNTNKWDAHGKVSSKRHACAGVFVESKSHLRPQTECDFHIVYIALGVQCIDHWPNSAFICNNLFNKPLSACKLTNN